MNWDSIISITIAAIGVGISILAFIEAKKANKTILRQNTEKELADIDKEIKNNSGSIDISDTIDYSNFIYSITRNNYF